MVMPLFIDKPLNTMNEKINWIRKIGVLSALALLVWLYSYGLLNKILPAPSIYPEHGKVLDVNGEKFRIVYLGGQRFRFPMTNEFQWNGGYFEGDYSNRRVDMYLFWPDIPPGKAPETKHYFYNSASDGFKINLVHVKIVGEKESIDPKHIVKQSPVASLSDYIIREDLTRGLRIYFPKQNPDYPAYVYPLSDTLITPLQHEPVRVHGNDLISFNYSPTIEVRVSWEGYKPNKNAPDWKGMYLDVVETLNKYREDQPSTIH